MDSTRNPTAPPELVHTRAGIDVELRPSCRWSLTATLVVYPHHTEDQIERAKREIRKARAVMSIAIRRTVSP